MTHLQVGNTRKVFKIDHIIQLWLITLSSHVAGWRILNSLSKDLIKNALQLCSLPLFISCFYIYPMTICSNAAERNRQINKKGNCVLITQPLHNLYTQCYIYIAKIFFPFINGHVAANVQCLVYKIQKVQVAGSNPALVNLQKWSIYRNARRLGFLRQYTNVSYKVVY